MKYKSFVIIFLLLILLSACSLNKNKSTNNNDWQNEVLLAQECGMDGLPCCPDKNNPCQYEQVCCVNPNNNNENYCSSKCEFGTKDQFCRSTNPMCDEGLSCADSYCKKCGNKDDVCCKDSKCNNDLVCHQNKCIECGLPGNPCCSSGKVCRGEGNLDETRTECQSGICVLCGSLERQACSKEPFCNKSNLLNNNTCYTCGGFNQPCCQKNDTNLYECNPDLELRCDVGFCINEK